jgi:hypothetical protein
LLSRATYHNLLDAAVLQADNPIATAIVYLSSEGKPQVITRAIAQGKKGGYLSMATARRLAEQYGASEVKQLIQRFA